MARPKQKNLPGTEDETNRAVEQAADSYWDVMCERCELSKTEKDARDNLLAVMQEEKVTRYKMPDGRLVMVLGRPRPSCRSPRARRKRSGPKRLRA